MTRTPLPPFDSGALEHLARLLGEAATGSQLSTLFAECRIDDVSLESTKWRRIRDNLAKIQNVSGCSNGVARFVMAMASPTRFIGRREDFEALRDSLNEVLLFNGLQVTDEGTLRRVQGVSTLGEAEERARRLRHALLGRDVHADVLKFCRAELLAENYFHAVLEASKSIAQKIRSRTGLKSDGSRLIDDAFGRSSGTPLLAFNSLQSPSEISEHNGMISLMKGVFSSFRNPTAHEPKAHWQVSERDALDLIATLSLLHRRLDAAVLTGARAAQHNQ